MSPKQQSSIPVQSIQPVQPVQPVQPIQPIQPMTTTQNVPIAQPISNLSTMHNVPTAQQVCLQPVSSIPLMQPVSSLTSTIPHLSSTQQVSQLGYFSPISNQATYLSSPSYINNPIPTLTSQPSVQLPIPEDVPSYYQLVTGVNDNGISLTFQNFNQPVYQPTTMSIPPSSNEADLPTLG